MTTPHEANLINEDRHKQEQWQVERLKDMGISIDIRQMSGDNAFPTEYSLHWNGIFTIGPTLDIALASFLGNAFTRLAQAEARPKPDAMIWDTATDLAGSEMERKKYWLKIEDEGKEDLRCIIVRGPGAAVNVEPYVLAEYDYDARDTDEDEMDDEGYSKQWRYEHGFYDERDSDGDADEEDEDEEEVPATAPLTFDKPEDFIL